MTAAIALAFALAACRPTPPVPIADETPDGEFILEAFEFEERRDGQLLWRGHAARGSGDVATSDVADLDLTYLGRQPPHAPLCIHADTAHLALAAGRAHFRPVLAWDQNGRRLSGMAADYDEAQSMLRVDGPVRITSPQGCIDASSATLAIEASKLVLEGPVTGRILPTVPPSAQATMP